MVKLALLCVLVCGAFAQWKAIDTDLETFDTGIDFTSDLVGYTAGDDSTGPDVYQTTDGLLALLLLLQRPPSASRI